MPARTVSFPKELAESLTEIFKAVADAYDGGYMLPSDVRDAYVTACAQPVVKQFYDDLIDQRHCGSEAILDKILVDDISDATKNAVTNEMMMDDFEAAVEAVFKQFPNASRDAVVDVIEALARHRRSDRARAMGGQ